MVVTKATIECCTICIQIVVETRKTEKKKQLMKNLDFRDRSHYPSKLAH